MNVHSPTTAPRLVHVASYLNSAEAELARVRLAMDNIPVWLENATLVLWCWYYSDAVGGVKVFVPEPEAERAWTILHPPRESDGEDRPLRTCPACEMQLDSAWTVCWRCGCTAEGERDPNFFEPPPPLVPFPLRCPTSVTAAIVGISGPLLFLASGGWVPLLLFWVFAVVLVLGLRGAWPADEDTATPPDDLLDRDEIVVDVDSDTYTAVEAAVFRVWKAAVFSFCFPPLALYSLWLLMRLDAPDAPLPPREQRRCLVALTISLIEVGLFALFLLWR